MKARFWLERWQSNQIAFHQPRPNTLLAEHWHRLALPAQSRVFVPLCGKSLDMRWLADAGHGVVGVELARIAVEGFFADEPHTVEEQERFVCYEGAHATIFQGDFFDLTTEELGDVQAVFDRGALVALPPDMRARYVDHLLRVVPDGTRMLLLTLEYNQGLVPGPPHAVLGDEVEQLYGQRCEIALIDSFVTQDLPPRFAEHGVREAVDSVYLITKRD